MNESVRSIVLAAGANAAALFSTAASLYPPNHPNTQYSAWRRWADVFLLTVHYFGSQIPGFMGLMRISMCLDSLYSGPLKPYAPSMRQDPWMSDYPCTPIQLDVQGRPLMLSLRKMVMRALTPEGRDWYRRKWWWVVPYGTVRYGFRHIGTFFLLYPTVLLLPLVAPQWWHRGGRTVVMASWRISAALLPVLGLLLLDDMNRFLMWDIFGETPSQILMLTIVKRGFIAMVPWPTHWRVCVAESALMFFFWLARIHFKPSSIAQLYTMVMATLIGIFLSLALNVLERQIQPYLAQGRVFLSQGWGLLRASVRCGWGWLVAKAYAVIMSREVVVAAFYASVLLVFHVWVFRSQVQA